jgi:hypothetical protein
MSSFTSAVTNALRSISNVAGTEITYARGNDWIRLTAVPGKTIFDSDETNNVVGEFRTRDYIIDASTLLLNDVLTTPLRGDLITEVINGITNVYEVNRPDGGNDQPWRYSDYGQSFIRVHTLLKSQSN